MKLLPQDMQVNDMVKVGENAVGRVCQKVLVISPKTMRNIEIAIVEMNTFVDGKITPMYRKLVDDVEYELVDRCVE